MEPNKNDVQISVREKGSYFDGIRCGGGLFIGHDLKVQSEAGEPLLIQR